MRVKDYSEILPIRSVSDGEVINSDLFFSIGFRIQYPDVFLSTKEWYGGTQDRLTSMLGLFPDNTILHTISFFDDDLFNGDFDTVTNYVERARQLHYDARPIPYQEEYIVVTYSKRPLPKGFSSHVLGNNMPIWENLFKVPIEHREELDVEIGSLEERLSTAYEGARIERLDDEGLLLLSYKYLSLDYRGKRAENLQLPDIDFEKGRVDGQYFGLLNIGQGILANTCRPHYNTSPSHMGEGRAKVPGNFGQIYQGSLYPIMIGLPFPHCVSCAIQKLSVKKVSQKLELEARSVNLPASLGWGLAKEKKKTVLAMKEIFEKGEQVPCNVAIALVIKDTDQRQLRKKMELAKTAVTNINKMSAVEQGHELPYMFLAHCPFNANQIYKHELTSVWNAVTYLPKESHYWTDGKGFYFCDRFGRPLLVDIMGHPKMTNKNGMVIGPSGRGKSFTLNYLATLLYNGGHLIIVDKGGSYSKLVELFGGMSFDSNDMENFSFNLFACERDKKGNYMPDELHLNFVSATITFIWKRDERATQNERNVLDRLIGTYYDHINREGGIPGLKGFLDFVVTSWDTFPEKYFNNIEIDRFFDLDGFRLMLLPYTEGRDRDLFNAESAIDLTYEKLTYFELRSLEKSNPMKFNLICILITFLNIKKIQKLPKKIYKTFLIDEALSFLKGDIGSFIGNLYAEARKENGQVLIAAQGISYIKEADPEVQAKIFANRDFIMLTNHGGYENSFEEYRKLLDFKDKDIEMLSSVEMRSEVFFRFGDMPMVLKVDVSPYEMGVYTMHENDLPVIEELKKKHGSLHGALLAFAEKNTGKT